MRLVSPFVYVVYGAASVFMASATTLVAGLLSWQKLPQISEALAIPLGPDLRTPLAAAAAVVAGIATHRLLVRAVRDDKVSPVASKPVQPDVVIYHSGPYGTARVPSGG